MLPGADSQWFLGTVEHDGIVAAGGSYHGQATFQLSPEISGKYVIVDTNTGNGSVRAHLGRPLHQQQHQLRPPPSSRRWPRPTCR